MLWHSPLPCLGGGSRHLGSSSAGVRQGPRTRNGKANGHKSRGRQVIHERYGIPGCNITLLWLKLVSVFGVFKFAPRSKGKGRDLRDLCAVVCFCEAAVWEQCCRRSLGSGSKPVFAQLSCSASGVAKMTAEMVFFFPRPHSCCVFCVIGRAGVYAVL